MAVSTSLNGRVSAIAGLPVAAARAVTDRLPVGALGSAARAVAAATPARVIADRVAGAVPAGDLDERDTDYIRETLPGLWLIASRYFRADVDGLHHISPEGPVLLVGNHSGGIVAPDLFVFVLAFSTYFGVERPFYQLAHDLVVAGPTGRLVRPFGTIAASSRNAELALKAGAAVLVYPGGDYEVFRPSWDQSKVDFGGRKGYVRTALKLGAPIQPVVSIGSQETALFLTRGERLARVTGANRILRLKTLPIAVGLPFGLMPAVFGHLPLPAKITVRVLPRIDLEERYGKHPDIDEIDSDVRAQMQDVLTSLAEDRRLPVLG
jgi:1-acyl-sn-glycerol-3-phosphate acyltransferase